MDKQIVELLDGVIGVVVPEGALTSFVCDARFVHFRFPAQQKKAVSLPPGHWEILGLGDQLTEEQWKGVVHKIDADMAWYPTYNDPDSGGSGYCYDDFETDDPRACYYTATESGLSLLASKGLKPQNTLILKKES